MTLVCPSLKSARSVDVEICTHPFVCVCVGGGGSFVTWVGDGGEEGHLPTHNRP